MKVTRLKVQNYRLLKDFSIDINSDLSLVIGKNNCGKTSLLSVMNKFINSLSFAFDDFNIDFKNSLRDVVQNPPLEENYESIGITLRIEIEYGAADNLAEISKLMMDLDPNNKRIVLLFEYVLPFEGLKKLSDDFSRFETEKAGGPIEVTLNSFLKESHSSYFRTFKKTIDPTDDKNFIDLEKAQISLKNVINYQFIRANRDVSNEGPDKSLSSLSSKIYKKIEADETQQAEISKFKDTLCVTDVSLNSIYDGIFTGVIEKVKKFGGMKLDDTVIKITSTLQHRELLEGNTTVTYEHDAHSLPESYNGLGYMNLISMIFEIEILLEEFKRKLPEKPAEINLLFIEEPEAHTHPQMQYVFIKNIKDLLKDGIQREGEPKKELQYIISTHSSHIVAESDFNDIKYLKRTKNSVIAKNLKDLEVEYTANGEEQNYKFLKQYLTLHRAELFFADKAIFIEGDTERILLPAMMKKVDQEEPDQPLISQNISIVEVGNYSHIFEKFIDFVEVRSLIITDIDSAKSVQGDTTPKIEVCRVTDTDATITTNASLKFFYESTDLANFKEVDFKRMVMKKDPTTKKWSCDEDGYLLCVYQTNEKNSEGAENHARSFEEAFFHLNRRFIIDNKGKFKSLKKIDAFEDNTKDSYELAELCINKKPPFAIEILINSTVDDEGLYASNWETPAYIKQGLLWLKKD